MWWVCVISFNISLEELLLIIDDALTNGFEFMVANGVLYFRELDT